MRLLILCFVGFVTWGLVVLRGFALESRRTWALGSLIFVEESIAVGVCIWFARSGGFFDVVACAIGGACAAMLLLEIDKHRNPPAA
jgi:hypothetical protein